MNSRILDLEVLDEIAENACSGMFSDVTNGDNSVKIWNNFRSTGQKNVLGVIRTIELEAVVTDDENLGVGLPFLTSLEAGSVLVVKGADHFAYFGELMANLAQRVGVKGSIIFGASRDSRAIQRMSFPLFATSFTPVDIKGRGRVRAVDVPLFIDDYEITPRSWVFADSDGAVFVPARMIEEVLEKVYGLMTREREIVDQIRMNLSGEELANMYKGF